LHEKDGLQTRDLQKRNLSRPRPSVFAINALSAPPADRGLSCAPEVNTHGRPRESNLSVVFEFDEGFLMSML
jgi:hypothetical protein